MIDRQLLTNKFQELYGREARFFRAPGRVNLIGEHTDYNGGFVLPMAIEHEAVVAAAVRDDRIVRVHSLNINESAEFDLNQPANTKRGSWLNYVEGVARVLESRGVKLRGADLTVLSSVPAGAGLSSSAALEISTGLALTELSGQTLDRTKLALVGQAAEHEYVGARVGIMDQFISATAQAGHALLIDCRSLETTQVPLNTAEVAVVIVNSNVKHSLASSEYNTRRAECERAVEILKQFLPGITQLRDVSSQDFEQYETHLPEPIRRRARHVITEIERTTAAAQLLQDNDLENFGHLMWESHRSLREDYEVSCRELDVLVEIAGNGAGVLGARMTGGGFGGSTVNLVQRDQIAAFSEKILSEYQQQTNITPAIYVSNPGDGAREI